MVLQNIGQKNYEDYHHDAAWGQDILQVGKTLGTGGFGFWNGKSVDLASKVKTWDATIVENGALYSAFTIKYNQWQVNNHTVDLSSTISMNAGSRLAHTHLAFSLPTEIAASTKTHPKLLLTEEIPNIAIGVVKHKGTKLILGNETVSGSAWTYAASWGKQSLSGADDYLGMAVIFKRGDRERQTEDEGSYVTVMKNMNAELDYYFVAAWDKELNGIKTEAEFKAYLDQEVERLTKTTRLELTTTLSVSEKKKTLDAETALTWSKRLADSDIARKTFTFGYGSWDDVRDRKSKFDYDMSGLHILALQELNKVSPNDHYKNAAQAVTGSFIADTGQIHTFKPELFSIDLINPGRVLINLETSTHQVKYRKAVDFLREHLKQHPRTSEGAFWHRITYPNQLWLDGVYMGIPFLAQYAATYETGAAQHQSFKEAVHEFQISRSHLRDPNTGLYKHAWDESKQAMWADAKTGLASQYWARGSGWLAMAMVDVLDYLPESEVELRNTMIAMVNEFAGDIVRYQDAETGTWWQILDKPHAIGNYRESTASAMYSYFLSKAVNKGYLSSTYKPYAEKAFNGLVNEFISVHSDGNISMNMQCQVAGLGFGRDGSYDYYMTEPIVSDDPKGNGPFILAGIETYKMLKK
jgi:unsaturated rhamnogalacturonyl hydrolase